uniref:AlNc14C39G3346 protein n=1 Tax=Albugo laibachii Nc14 TaxID=890382 RepID=F0W979_9STRA|nr:AlNc14C39G3346 [Albugo laibachii Nc14]|eukprot:CCA17692.1 AlNc14C39G3346 [Albugo laibachii Nc14]
MFINWIPFMTAKLTIPKKHLQGFGQMEFLDEFKIEQVYVLPILHLTEWLITGHLCNLVLPSRQSLLSISVSYVMFTFSVWFLENSQVNSERNRSRSFRIDGPPQTE